MLQHAPAVGTVRVPDRDRANRSVRFSLPAAPVLSLTTLQSTQSDGRDGTRSDVRGSWYTVDGSWHRMVVARVLNFYVLFFLQRRCYTPGSLRSRAHRRVRRRAGRGRARAGRAAAPARIAGPAAARRAALWPMRAARAPGARPAGRGTRHNDTPDHGATANARRGRPRGHTRHARHTTHTRVAHVQTHTPYGVH